MKKLITTSIFAMLVVWGVAQQDAQYTQFIYNKLMINPGYAGSKDAACVTCLYRNQWVALDGAPTSANVSFHTPAFNDKVGLGITISNDRLGIENSWYMNLIYAYHIKLGAGKLGIGVQGSLHNYSADWNDTRATHVGDGQIPQSASSAFLPNFGAGLYYYTDKYFLGASVPRFLNNSIDFTDNDLDIEISRERFHAFFTGGYMFNITEKVKLQPAFLVKYSVNAPLDLDLHTSVIFFDKLWVGGTVRLGGSTVQNSFAESIDAIVQYQLTNALKVGIAYDYTLSELQSYNDGTFEVVADYCFRFNGKKLLNPRFF